MQLIINLCTMAKNPAKNPRQKPPKNPWQKLAKNPMRTKICLDHAKNFYEYFNIKILNNTKNFLILPNKTKNP